MSETLTVPGTILLGKYRVEKVLGQGSMGVVVAATHLGLGQRVAMKFMLPGKGTSPERQERFLREARIAARLTSPHTAKVLDVGTMADGVSPYLVMEFLDGQDLDALLKDHGVLSIADAVSYVLQACEAVAEAHRAGIVHRDLKPANLFLARFADGSPCIKVLDFGVSKLIEPGADLTMEAAVLGSPLYMSPEQMHASKNVDARSDVWALGIVLYQLIAGTTPFHGESLQEVCGRVFQGEPTPLAAFRGDAPSGLAAVLLRCFEKRREERWQNVAEFAAALVPFGSTRAILHAERAAAILGLSSVADRLTVRLPSGPPPPPAVSTQSVATASSAVGGSLDSVAKPSVSAHQSGGQARPALVFGLVALTLAGLATTGIALWRGGARSTQQAVLLGASTSAPIAPTPLPQTSVEPSAGMSRIL